MARVIGGAGRLEWKHDGATLLVEAWSKDGLRVRYTRAGAPAFSAGPEGAGADWALLPKPADGAAAAPGIRHLPDGTFAGATLANGAIVAELDREGRLAFRGADGRPLLAEYWRNRDRMDRFASPLNLSGRELKALVGGAGFKAAARFEPNPGERLFGLGQYQDGLLDKKGAVLELAHRNAQSSVPFVVSDRGYGFLWNNPAVGRASFGANLTLWEADLTDRIDYWICAAPTPKAILERYTEAVGRAPRLPDYALGFVQSRMRYRDQAELLAVAREHKKRGLPLDMLVIDFFHWTAQGDWRFDPADWPDAPAMVRELRELGIEPMVSIWPTVDTKSENYKEMLEAGLLIQVDRGLRINMNWMGETVFFDATNPEAGRYLWSKAKANYLAHGIKTFWLDEAEPEFGIYDFDVYRYAAGPALAVTNWYPVGYAKAFADGQAEAGLERFNLVRTAWAGSQRLGALVWSGDVYSDFRSMREQLAAGLSIGVAGIPWWTSDIGGFHGGNPDDPAFRELMARWFAWGAFCPVFRLHGDRVPYRPPAEAFRGGIARFGSGSGNEVWSFGDEVYAILVRYLRLRERLKPYLRRVFDEASATGAPVMRPLWLEFPDDPAAWDVADAYCLGPDLLVAPVLQAGAVARAVYLPAGAAWTDAWTGQVHPGGRTVQAEAPLDRIPLFRRDGAALPIEEDGL
jgi:alpha-D-xyloside xylohydrolase